MSFIESTASRDQLASEATNISRTALRDHLVLPISSYKNSWLVEIEAQSPKPKTLDIKLTVAKLMTELNLVDVQKAQIVYMDQNRDEHQLTVVPEADIALFDNDFSLQFLNTLQNYRHDCRMYSLKVNIEQSWIQTDTSSGKHTALYWDPIIAFSERNPSVKIPGHDL